MPPPPSFKPRKTSGILHPQDGNISDMDKQGKSSVQEMKLSNIHHCKEKKKGQFKKKASFKEI